MGIHKFIKVYRDRNKTQPPALPGTNFLSGLNLIHSILLDVEVICPDKLYTTIPQTASNAKGKSESAVVSAFSSLLSVLLAVPDSTAGNSNAAKLPLAREVIGAVDKCHWSDAESKVQKSFF